MKKIISLFAVASLILGMCMYLGFSVAAVSGNGTAESPYLVSSAADMLLLGDFPDAHFKLTKNINMNDAYGGWSTAGTFNGVLDGDGYALIGLNNQFVGTNNGVIKNLVVQVDGLERAGFVGTNNSTIERVYLFGSGIFLRMNATGTFVKDNCGTIKDCVSDVDVEVQGMYKSSAVGGFAGTNSGTVENCAYMGYIFSSGTTPNGERTFQYISPFIGENAEESADFMNDGGKCINCYYDYEETDDAQKNSGGAVKKSTAAMKIQDTYAGWDFDNVWAIDAEQNRGYPFLRCDRRFTVKAETPVPSKPVPVTPPPANSSTSDISSLQNQLAQKFEEATKPAEITVFLDGTQIVFDQPPVIQEGRTLVPIRAIFEAMGAKIDWNDAEKSIFAARNGCAIGMVIGDKTMLKTTDGVNFAKIALDVPPVIISSRTLVPARAVAEAFDCEVEWDGTARRVDIYTN